MAAGFLLAGLAGPAEARIGVGVDRGEIRVDRPLKPGKIYELPSIHVINTGDQPGSYGVSVRHQEGQEELRPEEDWFSFSETEFPLEPDKAQRVEISLRVPILAPPGEYYALLAGHPTLEPQGTSLGIAAATKLRFQVEPGNALLGVYHRVRTFLAQYSPWPYLILGAG